MRPAAVTMFVIAGLIVTGCAGGTSFPASPSSAVPSGASSNTSSAASPSPRPRCPNPNGGDCLGPLAAGTYTALNPSPSVTYTVPDGWGNYEDFAGGILLLPPGGDLNGVDAGTSDYIGLHTSVAVAAADCIDQPAPDVGRSPTDIAQALVTRPGLATTTPQPVSIGGLEGVVLDIRMANGWTGSACEAEVPNVVLLIGQGPSQFVNAVLAGLAIRLYLLESGPLTTLAIEIDDVSGGSHLDLYAPVVESVRFGS